MIRTRRAALAQSRYRFSEKIMLKQKARVRPVMPSYVFRPMKTDDLPLVKRWLAEPHVVQWWGDTHEQFELVSGDLEVEAPDNGLGSHPRRTRGIDQFIGEPDMMDRGHGSAFIRTFIDRLLASGAPRV